MDALYCIAEIGQEKRREERILEEKERGEFSTWTKTQFPRKIVILCRGKKT